MATRSLVAAEPFLIKQDYENYTADQHSVWSELVRRGLPQVQDYACREYLEGLRHHSIEQRIGCPNLCEITERLKRRPGWSTTAVSGFLRDVVKTVGKLQGNGIEFLRVSDSYYDALRDRVGRIDESLDAIRSLGILVDRDQEGYLLQMFSKPVEDRPTLFFEIIQRKGSRGGVTAPTLPSTWFAGSRRRGLGFTSIATSMARRKPPVTQASCIPL